MKWKTIAEMLPVYLVAGSQDCPTPTEDRAANLLLILEQALQAGITCFQFRDKGQYSLAAQPEKQKALAKQCLELCRQYDIPFIVDDNLDLAIELQADGIHVGQDDMSPAEIRQRTDLPLIIGLSTNTLAELQQAEAMPEVDYCGLGPVFPTHSKEKHNSPIGLNFIKTVREAGIQLQIVAIGGIKAEHRQRLRENGANGIAVISAITQAKDIKQAVKDLLG